MRSISFLVLAVLLGAAPPSKTVRVNITGMKFEPQKFSVPRGTTVEWKNDDLVPHTVTATDGSWGSPVLPPGRSFKKTFHSAGIYQIFCSPHPTMKNTVVVK